MRNRESTATQSVSCVRRDLLTPRTALIQHMSIDQRRPRVFGTPPFFNSADVIAILQRVGELALCKSLRIPTLH